MLLLLVPLPVPVHVGILWGGSGALGACQGPLWGAMMSLLSEEYGTELRTSHTALVLVMTKCGIAGEQLLASTLLASKSTSWMFLPSLVCLLLATAALQWLFCFWALPQCKDLGEHDGTTSASLSGHTAISPGRAVVPARKSTRSAGSTAQGKERRVTNEKGVPRDVRISQTV